jgi:hypothetical protein
LTDGSLYKGDFREDKFGGHGLLYCYPNEMIEATFVNGKLQEGRIKILVLIS